MALPQTSSPGMGGAATAPTFDLKAARFPEKRPLSPALGVWHMGHERPAGSPSKAFFLSPGPKTP